MIGRRCACQFLIRLVALPVTLAVIATAVAADPPAQEPSLEAIALFENQVRPLLARSCGKCHGVKKQESGLRLDSHAALVAGGDRGPAISLEEPESSLLLRAVRHEGDMKMPPAGKLQPHETEALLQWIKLGAPWPGDAATAATRGGEITPAERQFWSFQPITNPPAPAVQDAAWPQNDIDRFVLARLEALDLKPAPLADKRTLIRRATFDLTGLPPTPAEIHAFLADESPEALARVIDRLLASPHYGERWGRHWLDVVRYADTAGDGADYPVPEAYKYRNYVIDSFNRDKPYDLFVREQLAGDILARDGAAQGNMSSERYAECVTATGYVAVTKRFGYNLNNEFQHLDIADTLETLGRSLLGLSIGCARCHDHKYDPISAADYYGLYGIFASTQYAFPGGEELKRPQKFVPLVPPAEATPREQAHAAKLAQLDELLKQLDAEVKRLNAEKGSADKATAEAAAQPAKEAADKLAAVRKQRDELAATPPVEVAYGVSEATPLNAKIQLRGEPDRLGVEVSRRFLEILGGDPLPTGTTGSGRLQLAEWITRPSNPLFARVIVNRIWQYHFGAGLVRTASDFGTRGELPSHPELLDYLATRFIAGGWSIKALHREMMLSRVYQLASDDDPRNAQVDPANRWLWKFQRRRLDAESMRDAMLAVSGELNRTMPGAHPFPAVTTWGYTIHYPFHQVYDSNHRSVYLMMQRARRHPYLALFDGADPNISTAARLPTTTPTQALFLMNDPFVHTQSQSLAKQILSQPTDADRVRSLFETTTGRDADPEDQREALEFVAAYQQKLAALNTPAAEQPTLAWAALARVLLTSNAFLYVD